MSETDYIAKKCAKCKEVLPLTSFNKNKSKPDGLGTECRICANAHSKKYHKENPEAHIARCKTRYEANKIEYVAKADRWHKNNSARVKELKAAYREANREKIKEISKIDWAKHNKKRLARKKLYRQATPGQQAAMYKLRQTRKIRAMPAWADVEEIKAIYVMSAAITRLTGIKHHVDHFYPLKSDIVCGLHNEYNLRIIPAAENQAKGNSFPG